MTPFERLESALRMEESLKSTLALG